MTVKLSEDEIAKLDDTAQAAALKGYAPYSRFHVGAALLYDDGTIITGANFENASYGMTLCAETVAVAKASSEGRRKGLRAVAIAGGRVENGKLVMDSAPVTPCGRCRQVLNEVIAAPAGNAAIICSTSNEPVLFDFSDLLPQPFGPAQLGIDID
ncbi:cytidine deaminase [Sphingorhabdus sp. Alg239-R122]|uniref:cytidine deaminase n=1 Tax=Sphingorhabdus sp. Alg239-R122 TaxID=2305989 RepID=UPI0013DA10EA|nr:cytidine deaminase [Sphingorhabdus sp. Alg239-R122]